MNRMIMRKGRRAIYSLQITDLRDDTNQGQLTAAYGSASTNTDSDMGVMIDGARILLDLADIEASNGLIHVIDAVLTPNG